MGIDLKICELIIERDRIIGPSFSYIGITDSGSGSMRQKIKLGMTLLLLIGIMLLSRKISYVVTNQEIDSSKQVIVIDPGHGGEDPGKVGVNGALEKDINLQIAKKLKRKLEANGFQVKMTREEDQATGMKERLAIIEKAKPLLTISVHQNSFSEASIHGAQVFYYSKSEEGRKAAEAVQNTLLEMDSTNSRKIKANSEYYLLKKTSVPIIIVECGFLSNPQEADTLLINEYQEEIAESICIGVLKWLDK